MNARCESNRTDAAREAKNKYLREWRRKNPDKVRAANNRYWEKKAAKVENAEGTNTSDNAK